MGSDGLDGGPQGDRRETRRVHDRPNRLRFSRRISRRRFLLLLLRGDPRGRRHRPAVPGRRPDLRHARGADLRRSLHRSAGGRGVRHPAAQHRPAAARQPHPQGALRHHRAGDRGGARRPLSRLDVRWHGAGTGPSRARRRPGRFHDEEPLRRGRRHHRPRSRRLALPRAPRGAQSAEGHSDRAADAALDGLPCRHGRRVGQVARHRARPGDPVRVGGELPGRLPLPLRHAADPAAHGPGSVRRRRRLAEGRAIRPIPRSTGNM